MSEYKPVTTLADLDSLCDDEVNEGYRDGRAGEPEPGNNRSRSYWHGWRNGNGDKTGVVDQAQRELARAYLTRMRTTSTQAP